MMHDESDIQMGTMCTGWAKRSIGRTCTVDATKEGHERTGSVPTGTMEVRRHTTSWLGS